MVNKLFFCAAFLALVLSAGCCLPVSQYTTAPSAQPAVTPGPAPAPPAPQTPAATPPSGTPADNSSSQQNASGTQTAAASPPPTAVPASGGPCRSSLDCELGLHCFNGNCLSNDVLQNAPDCVNGQCSGRCSGCKFGVLACSYSSVPSLNEKCVECFTDNQCKAGYACEAYACMPIS